MAWIVKYQKWFLLNRLFIHTSFTLVVVKTDGNIAGNQHQAATMTTSEQSLPFLQGIVGSLCGPRTQQHTRLWTTNPLVTGHSALPPDPQWPPSPLIFYYCCTLVQGQLELVPAVLGPRWGTPCIRLHLITGPHGQNNNPLQPHLHLH